ncbi:hypothetical protein SAMN05421823_101510 [Catalinimonas alkaloidigena]|uniref:Phosphoesterase n=1 Tax=Catalinimonas alkaloidigena TaxID=1075417 RepID=A0A1G8XXV4_9BACT|nr:hypothetical protein SAMN05421823_101510 [Catalinimonas alkaloidigena]
MKIGIISDTHGFLDEQVFHYFEPCEEIWHAGDWGSLAVYEQLAAFRPLRGVYGNIDGQDIRQHCPESQQFTIEGMRVWMIHIGGYPGRYAPPVRRRLEATPAPDLFVCGHSHILKVMSDRKHRNMLTINPGAAGRHGFHKVRTLVRMEVHDGKVRQMQAIELGPRTEPRAWEENA